MFVLNIFDIKVIRKKSILVQTHIHTHTCKHAYMHVVVTIHMYSISP